MDSGDASLSAVTFLCVMTAVAICIALILKDYNEF